VANTLPQYIGGSTPRSAEGYSKEIFAGQDASLLPEGVAVCGPQAVGVGGMTAAGVTITDLFSAMLMELRQITAELKAMRQEPYWVNTHLQNQ
jgi:hypothetical protein